jgi:hypothetical protein
MLRFFVLVMLRLASAFGIRHSAFGIRHSAFGFGAGLWLGCGWAVAGLWLGCGWAGLCRLWCSGAGPWLAAGARLSLRTSWDPPPEQDCQNFCV